MLESIGIYLLETVVSVWIVFGGGAERLDGWPTEVFGRLHWTRIMTMESLKAVIVLLWLASTVYFVFSMLERANDQAEPTLEQFLLPD